MTSRTKGDEVAPLLPVSPDIPYGEGQLWPCHSLIDMMDSVGPGVSSFIPAALALMMVQLQHLGPDMLPIRAVVKFFLIAGYQVTAGVGVHIITSVFGHEKRPYEVIQSHAKFLPGKRKSRVGNTQLKN